MFMGLVMNNNNKFVIINIIVVLMVLVLGFTYGRLDVEAGYNPVMDAEQTLLTPVDMSENKDGSVDYTLDVEEVNTQRHCLMFYTNHMEVYVKKGNSLLYSRTKSNSIIGHTTGSVWNIVEIPAGSRILSVKVKPVYSKYNKVGVDFYFGDGMVMYDKAISNSVIDVLACLLIIVTGFCLVVYYIMIKEKEPFLSAIFHLGVFAVLLGIWALGESEAAMFVFSRRVLASYIAFTCLELVGIPFVLFVHYFLRMPDTKLYKTIIGYMVVSFGTGQILQMLNIVDLKPSAVIIHIGLLLVAAYFGYSTIKCIIRKRYRRRAIINLIGAIILGTSMMLDLFSYYNDRVHANRISKFGFLIYIVILAIETARSTQKNLEMERKLSMYHELAIKDLLTDCYNRNAYEEQVVKKEFHGGETAIIFDLNNLKQCNDELGHNSGDRYIIDAAAMIKEIFERYGNVYRIGGDEFCVVIDKIKEEKVLTLISKLRKQEHQYNIFSDDVQMGIACGYAVFDANKDKSIEDTMGRADVLMYENKRELKE